MWNASVRTWTSVAAAAVLLAVSPWPGARADDAVRDSRPLDLAPSANVAPPADSRPPDSVSRLDLSPPPGLSPDLPPDPPQPRLDGATRRESALTPDGVAPVPQASPAAVAPPDATPLPPPTPDSGAAPAAETPAVAAPVPAAASPLDASRALSATPDVPGAAAPDATPNPVVSAPGAPGSGDILAGEIHKALDALVAAKAPGRPIGAGDWGAARKAIAAVYAERGYAPLWLDGDRLGARAQSALGRLARAQEDGLDLSRTPPPADIATDAPANLAAADIALSAAAVAYAEQASGARLNPRALSKDVTARPEVADPAFALKRVSAADDADAALADFNPPQPGYRSLRDTLARLRDEASKAVARFGQGPVLTLGMSDPRVPLIRARFRLDGIADPARSDLYDVKVASAVAAFQRVHGINASGALTEATAAALDGREAPAREKLILANMEMWRWQPRDMGETRVEVNVPDFALQLMSGETILHRARVIVGKPDTPTPIFSNSIKYMLFNPVWHVPESIVKKEMAPRLASDPDYLERRGYKVTYVGDKIEVEQPPGEANALGHMLFLFPNEHAVYLHDTPQRGLFSTSFRALSHGCVRVEDPARLAEILMGGAARGWTEARVHSLVGDKERTVSLPVPVPIHLQYFTEFVDERGRLQERADVYGLTGRVAAALTNSRGD